MAMMEVLFNYMVGADLLAVELPNRVAAVNDTAPILPFSEEDGIPPASFVLFVGFNEDEDLFTGGIVGFEMPFFYESYGRIREALESKLRPILPKRFQDGGRLVFSLEGIDLGRIDEDIKTDVCNVTFFLDLISLLDSFYFDIQRYHASSDEEKQAMEVKHHTGANDVTGKLLDPGTAR